MSRANDDSKTKGEKSPAFLLHKEGYTIEDYRLIARIGEGSFGEVWKAERGGIAVALKILKTSMTSDETQRELKSLETLQKLHHKFLLRTDNFWSDGDRLYIEMELADGGTLKERLKACQASGKPGIPESEILKYFGEAAKALDYLHGHRPVFLHRDIKPANILLVKGCAKLADFGLLRQVAGDNSSTKTQGGTFPYMAPESIASDVFSVYTDLFSFAVTYAELRQGDLPFSGKNQYQICEKILREPPELSELFHPDEKKVLLRALDKDPRQRFSSCGEFVFELNRVVPWEPLVDVPYQITPTPTERDRTAEDTDRKNPLDSDPGTTRRRSGTTLSDVNRPAKSSAGAKAPVETHTDGTLLARSAKTAPEPTATEASPKVVAKPPEGPKKDVSHAASPAPAIPRAKLQPKTLLAIGIAAGAVVLLTAGWFFASRSTQGEVRDLLAKGKYADALHAIADANRVLLPNPNQLRKEVEEKWWSELAEPDLNGSRENLKKAIRDLGKFTEAFPSNEPAKIRKDRTINALLDLLYADVDRALTAKNLGAAREVVGLYEEVLPDRGKVLNARIDAKQQVLGVLKRSEEKYSSKDFDGCIELLKAPSTPFDYKDDLDVRAKLLELATAGAATRDVAHQKLVASVEEAFQAKKMAQLQARLAELIRFRKDFAKTDWQPDVRKFQAASSETDLFADAWKRILSEKVSIEECRLAVSEIKSQMGPQPDPIQAKNLLVLESLVRAHQANKDEARKAVADLVGFVRKTELPGTLERNFWLALANLDKEKALLEFDDLDSLPVASADDLCKKAASDLYSQALERLVTKANFSWFPDRNQAAKCVDWIDQRVISASATLRAFRAECLLETGAPVAKLNGISLEGAADWYGVYVRALLLEKNKKHLEAATILGDFLKGSKTEVSPRERKKGAARILRGGVASFARVGADAREFANANDANLAGAWLKLAMNLDDSPSLDDLVTSAYAAIKGDPVETGKIMEASLTRLSKLGEPDRAKAYSWLGKVHRLELDLATTDIAGRRWDPAIEKCMRSQRFASQWRNVDLENAAALNAKALELEALAAFNRAEKNVRGEARYAVFDRFMKAANKESPKTPLDGWVVPAVIAKMEFAWSDECPATYLKKTIEEGELAVRLATKEEATRKSNQELWATLHCKALVRLADVNMRSMKERAKAKEAFGDLAKELTSIRQLYEDGRKMNKNVERWKGELAFKIGNLDVALGQTERAVREFEDSLKSLKSIPQPYAAEVREEIEQAQVFLQKALEALRKPGS